MLVEPMRLAHCLHQFTKKGSASVWQGIAWLQGLRAGEGFEESAVEKVDAGVDQALDRGRSLFLEAKDASSL